MSATQTDSRGPVASPAPPKAGPAQGKQPVGTWPWVLSAAIGIAVIFSAFSLNGVFLGWGWLSQVTVSVAAVLAATAGARILRVPAALIPVAGIAVLIAILTLMFFPGDSFLGVVPTTETLDALWLLLLDANQVVVSQVAPVQTTPGIVLVACVGLALVALLIDTLAATLQMPATSGLGLLAVLLVPAIVKPNGVGGSGYAAAVMGYLVLLGCAHWVSNRSSADSGGYSASQLNRAVAIGAAGLAATLVLPVAVPGFTSGLFPEGTRLSLGTSSGLNPMVTLGNDLRNPGSAGRMTYTTTDEEPVYLRAVTLENFDGSTWEPEPREDERVVGLDSIGSSARDQLRGQVSFSTTRIDAGDFVSPWLPVPYAPVEIAGLAGQWSVDPRTLSIMGMDQSTTADQSYAVTSISPVLTPETLADASAIPSDALEDPFLELPEDTPDLINETADEITSGVDNRYRKAMAIQNYLRSEDFVYSETAPVQGGYDGSSMDVVARFLEEKSGYCVHYSAAMAVMARAEGIPSRIAVGYAPGTATGDTVTNRNGEEVPVFEVDSDDAHAWPELYFAGLGWVKFEPTTSRGVVPDYAQPQTEDFNSDITPGNLNPQAPEDAGSDDEETEGQDQSTAAPRTAQDEESNAGWITAGVVAALLALLAMPHLTRRRISVSRLGVVRKKYDDDTSAITAWREVNDTAMDHGAGADPSETPRTFTDRLGRAGLLGVEASKAMRRLSHAYERAEYGRPVKELVAAGLGGATGAGGMAEAGGAAGPGGAAAVPELSGYDGHREVDDEHGPGDAGGRSSSDDDKHGAGEDVVLVNEAINLNSTRGQRFRAVLLPKSLWRPWRRTP
ncbi:transglutaminase TgpA family protein [Arthrobacter monumenti]